MTKLLKLKTQAVLIGGVAIIAIAEMQGVRFSELYAVMGLGVAVVATL